LRLNGKTLGGVKRTAHQRHTEVVMAKGDCEVEMRDDKGEVAGNLTIKNGKRVNIGGNTTLHCKDGNVKVNETNPTKRGVVKHPVLVVGAEGLRLARKRRKR
jgi:uncharacterized protein (UPF0333 family)